jgi:transcriptional regulator with GAF, ATPase, and Fis domain
MRSTLSNGWSAFLSVPARLGRQTRTFAVALATQPIVRRRFAVVVASVFVWCYALGVLSYVLLTPEIGVRCAFTRVVNRFDPDFLAPREPPPLREGDEIVPVGDAASRGKAWQKYKLREGDEIVQVGDRPVKNWSQLMRTIVDLNHEPAEHVENVTAADLFEDGEPVARKTSIVLGDQRLVRVRYERAGELRSVWLRVGTAPAETLVPSVLWFFLKIGLFLVGAIVFWKRPADRSVQQFFLLCICSFGAYIGGYHWWRIVTQPALLLVFMASAVLLPAVSLHFYLVFPRPKAFLERWPRLSLAVLYGPALVFLVLLLLGYLSIRLLYQLSPPDGPLPDVRGLLLLILSEILCYFAVALLWYLASLVALIHSYRTAANTTERNQVKWILYGAGAALVPIGYSVYLAFWEQGRFGGGAATWPMFLASLCVTAAFTVSITRYRLMQLDQLVSSGVVYFLISFVAGVVYYGVVFAAMVVVGSQVGEGPSLAQALAVSTTALVLMVALNLLRGRLQKALDRHFRREKHQLDRTLKRMSQAIEQLVDPPALARRLLHTSAELLGVPRGAVYLRQGKPPLYRLADALGGEPPLVELSPGCPLVEALANRGPLLVRPRTTPPDPAQRQLQYLNAEVAHALTHEGELLGILVLGPKELAAYTAEDCNLLTAFAQLTVLALVSAEGHRTIESLNKELKAKVEKIAEQQRRIIALQTQLTNTRSQRTEGRGQKTEDEGQRTEKPEVSSLSSVFCPLPSEQEGVIIGSSATVRQLMTLVRKVAASPSAVLLRGESGTGKGLLARAVHDNSPRAGKAFVKVHCAALSPTLLESELFGHVKGAFTNAIRDKAGRFEAAHGGTLFLDEIGDISLDVQTKLLRVLQEMTFERVGSNDPVKVDVRIIAATHQDLEELIRRGRFREDLFYRLNVFPITVPPLRERAEDVPELALHFLRIYAQRSGKEMAGIDDDAMVRLKGYTWPGNVRQLENVIERAVVIAEGAVVTADVLPEELLLETPDADDTALEVEEEHTGVWSPPDGVAPSALASVVQSARAERERREREQLVRALAAAGGNKAVAARALGVARSTLVSRLKRLGLG